MRTFFLIFSSSSSFIRPYFIFMIYLCCVAGGAGIAQAAVRCAVSAARATTAQRRAI